MLAATTNIKHKAAIGLTYATGLRASEVMALKISDIVKAYRTPAVRTRGATWPRQASDNP